MLTDLEFAYLSLDDLKPDPRNPRTHSKKQIQQIAASMTELGFAGAIVINPDRTIIAGHARYRAGQAARYGQGSDDYRDRVDARPGETAPPSQVNCHSSSVDR